MKVKLKSITLNKNATPGIYGMNLHRGPNEQLAGDHVYDTAKNAVEISTRIGGGGIVFTELIPLSSISRMELDEGKDLSDIPPPE